MRFKMIMCLTASSFLIIQSCKKAQIPALAETPGTISHVKVNAAMSDYAAISDYAEYTISCVAGGKFIEVDGNPSLNQKYADNAKIVQYSSSVSNGVTDGWQRWYVVYRTTVNNTKYYNLRNSFSGKMLDVPGGTTVSGTQLQQYRDFGGDQQLWRISEIGTTGRYNVINKASGLAVTNSGASSNNGSAITQEALSTNDKQKWVFTQGTANTYRDDDVVRFFQRNSTSQGSVAFDEGTSVPLTWSSNAGKVLWITQDSWDGPQLQSNGKFSCNAFFSYNNSMFIQSSTTNWDSNAPNITNNGNRKIVPSFNSNEYAWPGPGIEIGNHVWVQVDEGVSGSLSPSRQSFYDLTQSTTTAWTASRNTPAGMSNQTTIRYNTGMVKSGTTVYAFGYENTGFNYSGNLYVAKFSTSNPTSWTFWNGSSWVVSPVTGTGARIAEGKGTVSVSFVNGKYVLMTMDQGFDCDLARDIYVSTSSSPTGPFTTPVKVYSIKEFINGNFAQYYTPAIHPEHVNGRNELLITYCLNFAACKQDPCVGGYLDPYFYRVKGIRVPYAKIGL